MTSYVDPEIHQQACADEPDRPRLTDEEIDALAKQHEAAVIEETYSEGRQHRPHTNPHGN